MQPEDGEATESAVQELMPKEIGGPKPLRHGAQKVNDCCGDF